MGKRRLGQFLQQAWADPYREWPLKGDIEEVGRREQNMHPLSFETTSRFS